MASRSKIVRISTGLALSLAVATGLAPPVLADPIDTLSQHLRTLAAEPGNLDALMGAGQAALDVGDPNAALGFFVRAQEIDPRGGRAQAGMARSLVMLEKPDDALRLFAAAQAAGFPEAEFAGDRGLAYDLRGDSRHAQRDYAIALKRAPDDETTRRYALSLGIAGQRVQAIEMLEPLLKRQDQGAWRARAFILAMNGDLSGAERIARSVFPSDTGVAMTPFLARLGSLTATERAHAVNFGTVPAEGGVRFASASPVVQPVPARGGPATVDAALIPSGPPLGPPTHASIEGDVRVPQSNFAPAPGTRPPSPSHMIVRQPQMARAVISPSPAVQQPRTVFGPPAGAASVNATPPAADTALQDVGEPSPQVPAFETTPAPGPIRKVEPIAVRTTPPSRPIASSPAAVTPATAPVTSAVAPAPSKPAPRPANRLASILAGLEPESEAPPVALPDAAALRAARRAADKKAKEAATAHAAELAERAEKARLAAEAKRNPARIWVQVATGANAHGLPLTWRRIRDAHPKALKAQAAWSVPFKATNRLLVGPMKSTSAAKALVAALADDDVAATMFTSDAGQEISKLDAK